MLMAGLLEDGLGALARDSAQTQLNTEHVSLSSEGTQKFAGTNALLWQLVLDGSQTSSRVTISVFFASSNTHSLFLNLLRQ